MALCQGGIPDNYNDLSLEQLMDHSMKIVIENNIDIS